MKRSIKPVGDFRPQAPSLQSRTPHADSILTRLPEPYSSRLLVNAKPLLLSKGQALFRRGDPGDGCYWLQRGVLKIIITSPSGDERILAILGPDSIVGELAMIDELPRSATVEAISDCHLMFVSRVGFAACLAEYPGIYGYLVSTLVSRLRSSDEETAAASFLTVKARVARAFLQLARHLGEDMGSGQILIAHKISQNDLAAMAGVARESVSRTLGDWRRHKVISQSSRSNYVIHQEELEREAQPHT